MREEIAANLAEIRERADGAARRAKRGPGEVEVMVVSKTFPAELVQGAVDAGHSLFGENKVQEAEGKIPGLDAGLRWHLIGHLQRNKIRKALPLFEAVHSLDSLKLAGAVDRVAGELGLRPQVYLQVNLGREESKHGFQDDALAAVLDDLLTLEHVGLVGLMCIPPAGPDVRRWFSALRELRDDLEVRSGIKLPGLSMGMSHDYETAIEEGATMVRVGSAVFGPRSKR
jgi:pyridoxal phosphate enzyme (YggS family)